MPRRTTRTRSALAGVATTAFLCPAVLVATGLGTTPAAASAPSAGIMQPVLGTRGVPLITVNGYRFRDLDRSGDLTPYEDWRLPATERAADLVSRLTLEEKAGLMVHGSGPSTTSVIDKHITAFINRSQSEPQDVATANNELQQVAEAQSWGIPVLISSDPRNGFTSVLGQTVGSAGNTLFPEPIGMAAARDTTLTRQFGSIVRKEYRAVGILEALSPQADLATEPRWDRINGTFGSNPQRAERQVNAYITGIQGGTTGLGTSSVAAVVKHWAGYGAQIHGWDSHYFYGRYASVDGTRFGAHLTPFQGAFDANVAGVMPTYSILKNLKYEGTQVEQVGAGFSSFLLQNLLRDRYKFNGVVVSDWGIGNDCPTACQTNTGHYFFGSWGFAMPWGTLDLTKTARYAKAINAGVDQMGGSDEPSLIIDAVNQNLIPMSRINEAAQRGLIQKFQLGLFENPYVDPAAATRIVGSAAFRRVGERAQAKSLTLLTNHARTLPATKRTVRTVYLSGIASAAARRLGLKVVGWPEEADLAIVRLADPTGIGKDKHLNFTNSDQDYLDLRAAARTRTPTVAVPSLLRPLVLTNVVSKADAVLGEYGVTDKVLLETIIGQRAPGGRLPFELPSSMAQVRVQRPGAPDDTKNPLFNAGRGLTYPASKTRH